MAKQAPFTELRLGAWTRLELAAHILADEHRRKQLGAAIEAAGGDPTQDWHLELREVVMVLAPPKAVKALPPAAEG